MVQGGWLKIEVHPVMLEDLSSVKFDCRRRSEHQAEQREVAGAGHACVPHFIVIENAGSYGRRQEAHKVGKLDGINHDQVTALVNVGGVFRHRVKDAGGRRIAPLARKEFVGNAHLDVDQKKKGGRENGRPFWIEILG